jgi:hypothetical protein
MNNPELGKLITDNQERDAVHIAIIPVEAGERLGPGVWVNVLDGKAYEASFKVAQGIVDPYIVGVVNKGDKFFLLLKPNTITSLKHNWTHPAFPIEKAPTIVPDSDQVRNSKVWLEDFASSGQVSYDDLMEMAEERNFHFGTEMYEFNNDETKYLFWRHYEIVTRNRVPFHIIEDTYFGCSC